MDKIEELLTRGVDKIYPSKEELEKVLRSGKKLKLYQGFDPTGTELHIGHMVGLRKLRQWQDLGHHVIFLIGDGTVQAGDPSGKLSARVRIPSLLVGSNTDRPGILRQIAQSFEQEGINMISIDSLRTSNGIRFKIKLEKNTSPKMLKKVSDSLIKQGFFIEDELRQYAKAYVQQAKKIVDFNGKNAVEIRYNGDWLKKLSYTDILDLAEHFSLQQLAERDLFQERMKKGETVSLREFLYPLFQAYDSVAMEVDLELGGTDQTFNMLCGRTLIKAMKNKDKFVMTTPLLTDSKGIKIGKTEGNVIALTGKPEDLFGKIMALPDDVILKGFEYLTDISMDEVKNIKVRLDKGENPVKYKKRLAFEIVKQLNPDTDAQKAKENFEKTVQQKETPVDIPVFNLPLSLSSGATIVEILVSTNLAPSKAEAKRLIGQGGVTIDDQTVSDASSKINIKNGMIIRVGKRKYVKIKLDVKG